MSLGNAHHAARALHFLKAEQGVRVIQQDFDDDGEAQGGNAEIVGTQRQHRQAEEITDFGGKHAAQQHTVRKKTICMAMSSGSAVSRAVTGSISTCPIATPTTAGHDRSDQVQGESRERIDPSQAGQQSTNPQIARPTSVTTMKSDDQPGWRYAVDSSDT